MEDRPAALRIDNMKPLSISDRQIMYRDQYQEIYKVTADFGEFTKDYFVRDAGNKAGMIAVKDGSILLVKQYRFLLNGMSLEIPGGRVDDGETAMQAAVRECLEEAGVRCLNPKPLLFYQAGLDTTSNPTHLFFSDEISHELEPEKIHPNETVSSHWTPLNECIDMINNGLILDSFSIIALLAYQSRTSS